MTKPDVFNANCDSRQVLALIADRWSMLILYALSNRVRRHGELKRMIGGISQKMLTQTLRSLERDGLVRRSVFDVVPPRVEYALTPLGQDTAGASACDLPMGAEPPAASQDRSGSRQR